MGAGEMGAPTQKGPGPKSEPLQVALFAEA